MLIDQYNDVINTLSSSTGICKVGIEKYIGIFTNEITNMISKFSDNITEPLKVLELLVDENVVEAFDAMQKVLDDFESMQELVSTLQTINGTQYKFNNAIAAMLLLQSYILEGVKVKK